MCWAPQKLRHYVMWLECKRRQIKTFQCFLFSNFFCKGHEEKGKSLVGLGIVGPFFKPAMEVKRSTILNDAIYS